MASNLADQVSELWESEDIPDTDFLYMRVPRQIVEYGEPYIGAFRNWPTPKDGMSTDWDRYAKPEQTRARGRRPADNAVISMNVGYIREVPTLSVKHTPVNYPPEKRNRAHTDVFGPKEKNAEERLHLSRKYTVVLPLEK
jgi:hypothetical protein